MQCKHIKLDQTRCKAKALTDDEYCFMHSPRAAKQREEANLKGGQHSYKKILVSSDEITVKTPQDIAGLLECTINEVRSGKLDVKIANCVGYLSSHLLRTIEFSELEKRLENIESAIEELK